MNNSKKHLALLSCFALPSFDRLFGLHTGGALAERLSDRHLFLPDVSLHTQFNRRDQRGNRGQHDGTERRLPA